jgi:hypothetical protein
VLRFHFEPLAILTWRCEPAVIAPALPRPLKLLVREGQGWLSLVLGAVCDSRIGGVALAGGAEAIVRTYVDGPRGPGVYQLRVASSVPWVLASAAVNGAVRADRSLAVAADGQHVRARGRELSVALGGRAVGDPAQSALVAAVERGYAHGRCGLMLLRVRRRLLRIQPIAVERVEAAALAGFGSNGAPSAVRLETGCWQTSAPVPTAPGRP